MAEFLRQETGIYKLETASGRLTTYTPVQFSQTSSLNG